jgi:hypothetical protein
MKKKEEEKKRKEKKRKEKAIVWSLRLSLYLYLRVFSPLIRPESSCTVWDYGSLLEAHRNRLLMRAEAV